jgi:hypothetical protein
LAEPTVQYLKDYLQRRDDAQLMTVSCLFCPQWELTAPSQEARAAAASHIAKEHPQVVSRKRIVRRSRVFSQSMTREREEQIEEERRQRMRALGIG